MGSRGVRASSLRSAVRVASGGALVGWLALAAPVVTGPAAASGPTPLGCNQTALDGAGASGGNYTFACSNKTIPITAPVDVTASSLTINGTGQGVIISVDRTVCVYPACAIRIFKVESGATFDLSGVELELGISRGADGVPGTPGGQGEAGTDGSAATTGPGGTGGQGGAMWIASGATVSLDNVDFFGNNAIGGNGGSGGSGGNGAGGTTGTAGTSTGTGMGCETGNAGGAGTSGGDGGAGGNGANGSDAQGGAIFNAGQLTVTSSSFSSNHAQGGGGGNAGSGGGGGGGGNGGIGGQALCMGNTSGNGGVGGSGGSGANAGNAGDAGKSQGGAIYSTGTLTVSGSTFTSNAAGNGFPPGVGGAAGSAGLPGGGGGAGNAGGGSTAGHKGADGSYGAAGTTATAGKAGDTQGGAVYTTSGQATLASDIFTSSEAIGVQGGHGGTGAVNQDGEDGGAGADGSTTQGGAVFAGGPLTVNATAFEHDSAIGGQGGLGGNGGDANGFPGAGTGGTGGTPGTAGIAYGGGVFVDAGQTANLTGVSFTSEGAEGGSGGPGGDGGGGHTVDPATSGTGGTGADGGMGGAGFGGALFSGGTTTITSAACDKNAAGGGPGGDGGFGGNGFNSTGMEVSTAPDGATGSVGTFADNDFDGTASICAPVEAGGLFPLKPTRILDTRSRLGSSLDPVPPGGTVSLQVGGVADVPAGNVGAVVLNVTVTQPTDSGFLTVYPDGDARPTVSNLNFSAGETIPNLVVARLGGNGKVDIYNGSTGTVQILADVSGYFSAGTVAPGGLTTLPPARILDTRSAKGASGPVAAGATVHLNVQSVGGLPGSGALAVILNVTVTDPKASGFLTVYKDLGTKPTVSNLNFKAGETIPNLVVAPVGGDGKVAIYNGSAGTVQIIGDVSGWFSTGTPSPGGLKTVTPTRFLDTRSTAPVAPGGTVRLLVDTGPVTSPATAVVVNVTVTQPKAAGFLTVFPDGLSRPTVSNLNFVAGETIPNLVIAPVGADGKVAIFNGSASTVQVLVDASGYFPSG